MRVRLLAIVVLLHLVPFPLRAADSPARLELKKGDRIVIMGDTFAERAALFGHIEAIFQTRFPDLQLTFRNLGYSADTPAVHVADITKGDGEGNRESNRALNFGTMTKHLTDARADVVFLCFGMVDSFQGEAGLTAFTKSLQDLLKIHATARYNGKTPPRLVLVGPIAHERLGDQFPDPAEHNKSLKLYTDAMGKVAATSGLPFVDMFTPTRAVMETAAKTNKAKLTINGIHLTQIGYAAAAQHLAAALGFGVSGPLSAEPLRQAIVEQNQLWFYKWRAVNGEYVYGRRARPFGVVNFPGEMAELDKLVTKLDARIHELSKSPGQSPPSQTSQAAPTIAQVYGQKQGTIGGKFFPTAADPEEARKLFKLPDGYEINLYASEKDFPLHCPLALAWDVKGRLWVTTMPSYPQVLPGLPPDDKILILEDTKGAGKADKCTVFADKLYLPTGLEFGEGGVYVAQQPNMLFLKDNNGDDVADTREVILHGFGSGDSHHAMHAFVRSPEGALHFQEGVFHRTNTETPFGVLRQHDAGIYRFQPKSFKLETYVSYGFANPWGHVFDRWGYNFIADASGGANYNALPLTGHIDYPGQHPSMKVFTSVVRPTCGCELVSSRHFPPEAQGNFLVNNNIGFQGIKQHKVIEEGSGFTSKELEPLLSSSDRNFRPVDIKFGPDGALYVVDWFNPLIGHMQFSIRDPGRNHYHGRIWRITAKGRPLVTPAKIAGEPLPQLLDLLKVYEDRARYRVRAELRERPSAEVGAALKKWIGQLDENDTDYEHHLLEALWVYQGVGITEPDLLKRLLRAKDYRARTGATRALRNMRDSLPDALDLLQDQVNDVHPRVRLEAVIALSYFKDARAADIALQALKHPTDYYVDYGLKETMDTLAPYWRPHLAAGKAIAAGNPAGANYLLATVSNAELVKMPRTGPVLLALLARDGVLPQYREEALAGLSKINKTDTLTELFAAIQRIDKGEPGHSDHVLHDLAHLLTTRRPTELATLRPRLEKLAAGGRLALTRQVAYVALVAADGSIAKTWTLAGQSLHSLRDMVDAVPYIPDAKLRQDTYPYVKELLFKVPDALAPRTKSSQGTKGRFVRIDLPGAKRTLTLAEVQVLENGVNVAPQGKAKQSSTAHGGSAQRALDGNTDGAYSGGGQTHTNEGDKDPWWEVDLGSERTIEGIVVWNRTDDGLGKRLDGFKLSVLDAMRHPVYVQDKVPAPARNVRFTLEGDPAAALRLAAMNAITSIPGQETEVFAALSGFIQSGKDRDAAIRALRRLPRNKWPQTEVKPLVTSLVAYVAKVPAKERTEPAVLDALQLGNDLATLLPPAESKEIRSQLGELGVQVVLVRTVPHLMAYDRKTIYVEAGKPAVIVLENSDIMPHNLVIGAPGSLAEIGLASEKIANEPDAFARGFVPKSPKVLVASRMLQPREVDRIQFVAPKVPGEYVYICTFPGHWRVMNGSLRVVPRLADVPAHELNPVTEIAAATRPFVRNWTIDELTPDLIGLERGRSLAAGKNLFKVLSCLQCHKVGTEGGNVGPDLLETSKKIAALKMSKIDLLTEIIEPSKKIDPKFKVHTIITSKGAIHSGIIVHEDKKSLRLVTGPQEQPRDIPLADVDERSESTISLMPVGLLVTLTKEEILDLLAYIVAGGQESHPAFRP